MLFRSDNGANFEAQFLCHELGLLPGWAGPDPNESAIRYDRSGARIDDLETALRAERAARNSSVSSGK